MRSLSAHTPGGGVADQRAVLPAVPESPDDVHELAGTGIPAVVFDQGALAEVAGRLRVIGGDDVPAGPAAADVIQRREPPGQVKRRAERGRRRRDQTDPGGGHRQRRQHQQRILIRLRKRPHPVGRDRQPVGEEHRVEQSALGQRSSPHQTLHADRIAGIVLVQAPAGLVIAVGCQEDDEVCVTLQGGSRPKRYLSVGTAATTGSSG